MVIEKIGDKQPVSQPGRPADGDGNDLGALHGCQRDSGKRQGSQTFLNTPASGFLRITVDF